MLNSCNVVDFSINPLIHVCVCVCVRVQLSWTITTLRFAHTLYFRNKNHYFRKQISPISLLMEAYCAPCEERREVLCTIQINFSFYSIKYGMIC